MCVCVCVCVCVSDLWNKIQCEKEKQVRKSDWYVSQVVQYHQNEKEILLHNKEFVFGK